MTMMDRSGGKAGRGWCPPSTEELVGITDSIMYAVVERGSELHQRVSMAWIRPRTGEAGESVELCVDTTLM